MPIRSIPGTGSAYHLIAFDADGVERHDDPGGQQGRMSARLLEDLRATRSTDLFLWCHGWKGDLPGAIDQYDRWIGAFERLDGDREMMIAQVPGFRAIHVGCHWPSQPWGDEEFVLGGAAYAVPGAEADSLVDGYAKRLGDTPVIRNALQTIFDEALEHADTDTLTPRARDAYRALDAALDLGGSGPGGDAGADRMPFDPDAAMEAGRWGGESFGDMGLGGLLGPLRQLSFWTMKKRGQTVGESGLHDFLRRIQEEVPAVRVHLMGHSFGCVVMSSMLCGPGGAGHLVRPVASFVLVQGAMSLWSWSPDIPVEPGTPGYCHRILAQRRVLGPVVTTRSHHDRAVGFLYPIAAGAARQVAFGEDLPLYGATGAFGLQGVGNVDDIPMLPATGMYSLLAGRLYNVDASEYVRKGGGISGAHSDIDGPEVAHLIWEAARPS